MSESVGRIHSSLRHLLGADPVALLRSGRSRAGLVDAARERLPTTISEWPVSPNDSLVACTLLERLALQIDRAADWVARGPEALPWLIDQRQLLVMSAFDLNRIVFHCSAGLRAFGENPSRFVGHPSELADRAQQLIDVLESRLDVLSSAPVIPDRSLPPDLAFYDGEKLGTIVEQGVTLTLFGRAQWDAQDVTLIHLCLAAMAPDGMTVAIVIGRRRENGSLLPGDVPSWDSTSPRDRFNDPKEAGPSPEAVAFIVDDVVVCQAFSGHALGARFIDVASKRLVGPKALVLLAARPRANRLPPESRERLCRYWRDAGWQPREGEWLRLLG